MSEESLQLYYLFLPLNFPPPSPKTGKMEEKKTGKRKERGMYAARLFFFLVFLNTSRSVTNKSRFLRTSWLIECVFSFFPLCSYLDVLQKRQFVLVGSTRWLSFVLFQKPDQVWGLSRSAFPSYRRVTFPAKQWDSGLPEWPLLTGWLSDCFGRTGTGKENVIQNRLASPVCLKESANIGTWAR